jgi:hypothetical protein
LVKVGVIAIDGTKVHANASHHSNVDYEQLAREILKEAGEIDAAEDALYGDARGDELPEHLRTREGRRAALRAAREKLARERGGREDAQSEVAGEAEVAEVKIELDSDVIVARTQGREGWLREARHQLDEHRRREAKPIVRSRAGRLLEAERRMIQDLEVERAANEAYEHYREHGRDTQGRRLSRPPKPWEPPGREHDLLLGHDGLDVMWCLWSFKRLWVAVINRHSESAADRPRRWNWLMRRLCLVCANTGSTIAFRRR